MKYIFFNSYINKEKMFLYKKIYVILNPRKTFTRRGDAMENIMRMIDTEKRNSRTENIDKVPIAEAVSLINKEDQKIALAVEKVIPEIAALIRAAVEAINSGGRLIYVGAGTSGRLGVLDASECPPTFGVSPDLVVGIIAGGKDALIKSQEGLEDKESLGQLDLEKANLTSKDVVVGLAASGRTPYVIGALKYANQIGAKTGSISCAKESEISKFAKYPIEVITGPEALTGSTRMKAGTAQKMVLNMISTTTMIQLGKVYNNLMIDVQATNEKLKLRAQSIIQEITDVNESEADRLLDESNNNVKVAIVMHLADLSRTESEIALNRNNGHIKRTLSELLKEGD